MVLNNHGRVPRRLDNGSFSGTVKEHYRLQYYEAIDLAVESIQDRFDQPAMVCTATLRVCVAKGSC